MSIDKTELNKSPPKHEYYITNHAVERFIARTRLFLPPEMLARPRLYMAKFIREGRRVMELDQYPFYRNKMGVTHVIKNGYFKFYMVNNVVVTFVYVDPKIDDWRY